MRQQTATRVTAALMQRYADNEHVALERQTAQTRGLAMKDANKMQLCVDNVAKTLKSKVLKRHGAVVNLLCTITKARTPTRTPC